MEPRNRALKHKRDLQVSDLLFQKLKIGRTITRPAITAPLAYATVPLILPRTLCAMAEKVVTKNGKKQAVSMDKYRNGRFMVRLRNLVVR